MEAWGQIEHQNMPCRRIACSRDTLDEHRYQIEVCRCRIESAAVELACAAAKSGPAVAESDYDVAESRYFTVK